MIKLATRAKGTKPTAENTEASTKPSTRATKKLEIVRAKDGYGIEVQYEGGGQLPKELKGKWLNVQDAEKAIKLYMATKGK